MEEPLAEPKRRGASVRGRRESTSAAEPSEGRPPPDPEQRWWCASAALRALLSQLTIYYLDQGNRGDRTQRKGVYVCVGPTFDPMGLDYTTLFSLPLGIRIGSLIQPLYFSLPTHAYTKIKPFPIADWDFSQKLIINNDGSTAFFSLWFHEFAMQTIWLQFPPPLPSPPLPGNLQSSVL